MFSSALGIALSVAGAILIWGVNTSVSGINIHTIGWIMLIVGIVAIVLSLIFWSTWADRRNGPPGPGPNDRYYP